MKTVTIDVTQEDIDRGEVNCCFRCPIAWAAHRALGYRVTVSVSSIRSYVDQSVRIRLPAEASQFIDAVDGWQGKNSVKPFSFEVEVPDEAK